MIPLQQPNLSLVLFQAGSSPLFVAASKGHVETCKMLMDHHASADLQDKVSNCSAKECADQEGSDA